MVDKNPAAGIKQFNEDNKVEHCLDEESKSGSQNLRASYVLATLKIVAMPHGAFCFLLSIISAS